MVPDYFVTDSHFSAQRRRLYNLRQEVSTHVLRTAPFVFVATVHESKTVAVIDLSCPQADVPFVSFTEPVRIYRDTWLNAIIQPLRLQAKEVHFFDRQHVMSA